MGETPRRSARISEKAKASPTPEKEPAKKRRTSFTKKEVTDDAEAVVKENDENKVENAHCEQDKSSSTAGMETAKKRRRSSYSNKQSTVTDNADGEKDAHRESAEAAVKENKDDGAEIAQEVCVKMTSKTEDGAEAISVVPEAEIEETATLTENAKKEKMSGAEAEEQKETNVDKSMAEPAEAEKRNEDAVKENNNQTEKEQETSGDKSAPEFTEIQKMEEEKQAGIDARKAEETGASKSAPELTGTRKVTEDAVMEKKAVRAVEIGNEAYGNKLAPEAARNEKLNYDIKKPNGEAREENENKGDKFVNEVDEKNEEAKKNPVSELVNKENGGREQEDVNGEEENQSVAGAGKPSDEDKEQGKQKNDVIDNSTKTKANGHADSQHQPGPASVSC